MPESCERLARDLVRTAWRAGQAVMRHFGTADVEMKGDNSPVTAADRDADALIRADLDALAPDIPIVSEESVGPEIAAPGPRFFLVDPLDGTKEFISRRGEFTINIALIEDSAPTFGLVYAPATKVLCLTVAAGRAAQCSLDPAGPEPNLDALALEPLRTRARSDQGLVAAASRSHLDETTRRFLADHHITETISAGSSLKFCLLAQGKADVYPRFGRTMEWDTAAGHAVLVAAGGVVLSEDGAPLRYGKSARGLDNPGFVAWGRAP